MSWGLCNVSPHDIYSIFRQHLLNYKFFICVWILLMQHSSIMKAKSLESTIFWAEDLSTKTMCTQLYLRAGVITQSLVENCRVNPSHWIRSRYFLMERNEAEIEIDTWRTSWLISYPGTKCGHLEKSLVKKNLNRYCFSFVNLKTNTYLNYLEKKNVRFMEDESLTVTVCL